MLKLFQSSTGTNNLFPFVIMIQVQLQVQVTCFCLLTSISASSRRRFSAWSWSSSEPICSRDDSYSCCSWCSTSCPTHNFITPMTPLKGLKWHSSPWETHLGAAEHHPPYGITWHRSTCPTLTHPDRQVLNLPTPEGWRAELTLVLAICMLTHPLSVTVWKKVKTSMLSVYSHVKL